VIEGLVLHQRADADDRVEEQDEPDEDLRGEHGSLPFLLHYGSDAFTSRWFG